MLKRLLLCIFLLSAALPAAATNYTDLWYIPAESGWGANIVQSDNFLFLTFFIYGLDGKPTWYSAQLTKDATGFYNGKLYATTGTYYGVPWTPGNTPATEVGTASFQPTSPYTARLLYIVNTPAPLAANVTKLIQRQTLTPITIGGSYVGAQSGAYSGCTSASGNGGYSDFFSLQVAVHGPDGDPGVCLSRPVVHVHRHPHPVRSALYSSNDGLQVLDGALYQRIAR